jgi:hypothetical protein
MRSGFCWTAGKAIRSRLNGIVKEIAAPAQVEESRGPWPGKLTPRKTQGGDKAGAFGTVGSSKHICMTRFDSPDTLIVVAHLNLIVIPAIKFPCVEIDQGQVLALQLLIERL